jgi:hypothetical protein
MASTKSNRRVGDAAARGEETDPGGSSLPHIVSAKKSKSPGGRSPRQKGDRAERALVKFFQDHGFAAERVPLSGSAGGRHVGDLTVPLLGIDRCIEVKVRRAGFNKLYAWLRNRDLLIVRADRLEPLVVIPLRLATEIAGAAERARLIDGNEGNHG